MTLGERKYLKAVFEISQRDGVPVNTSAIAAELHSTPASVTDMIQRLAAGGYLHYTKYKGVTLSEKGAVEAIGTIRTSRLWRTFLIQVMNFEWEEVEQLISPFEQIQNQEVIRRLDQLLDHPKFDPLGEPIPDETGRFVLRTQEPLAKVESGTLCQVIGVQKQEAKFLEFLNELKIKIGSELRVVDHIEFDQSLIVTVNQNKVILPGSIARHIVVREIPLT